MSDLAIIVKEIEDILSKLTKDERSYIITYFYDLMKKIDGQTD